MNNAAEPTISVVVPVYNAMPYLVTCLASVMEQSIGRERIEVVAVDDGSIDGSGDQLDLLAGCWDGLRVVHQERAGGPSRARNIGLDMAVGRYVFFLDADDYTCAAGQWHPPGDRRPRSASRRSSPLHDGRSGSCSAARSGASRPRHPGRAVIAGLPSRLAVCPFPAAQRPPGSSRTR